MIYKWIQLELIIYSEVSLFQELRYIVILILIIMEGDLTQSYSKYIYKLVLLLLMIFGCLQQNRKQNNLHSSLLIGWKVLVKL